MGKGNRLRKARKTRELSEESLYLVVRGLIAHVTSNMVHTQGEIAGMAGLQLPVEGYATHAKRRNNQHREVTESLKETDTGQISDWTTRDKVFDEIMGDLVTYRNFWAHAYIQNRAGVQWLELKNNTAYPDGLKLSEAATEGLAFLDRFDLHREYLTKQHRNLVEYLKAQNLLPSLEGNLSSRDV